MAQITQAEFHALLGQKFDEGAKSRDAEVAELRRWQPIQSVVVVSRKWHEPTIRVLYMKDGIHIEMTPRDFIKSVMKALDHRGHTYPPWWARLFLSKQQWADYFTRDEARFEFALGEAFEAVTHEMKLATVQSPPPLQKGA